MSKYPEYIMKNVRQHMGVEEWDTSLDSKIDKMSPGEVLDRYWEYEGLMGYTSLIVDTVFDVFGLDREEEDE